ncbi:trypsin alpha-3-like [Schistocerca nitens]|uniref:trypsin alpha-3-like n=1 Tax=Schistocerca nitens TaxID=7011 RepID=UPI002118EE9B|nr:trypsin alpha-3-like [Schistocerca nitens]
MLDASVSRSFAVLAAVVIEVHTQHPTASQSASRSSNGPTPEQLKYVTVNVTDTAVCRTRLLVLEGMLCAAGVGNEDFCQGDGGAPLVCNGSLAGVVSFGYSCGVAGYPSVYTDVSEYGDFFNHSLREPVSPQ